MSEAFVLPAESKRLDVVASLDLGSPGVVDFSDIVALACDLCSAPIALVTVVRENDQVFHAAIGLDGPGTPRDQSFCSHAIRQDQVMWIQDACDDVRFKENPLVTGEPGIRLYAGAPIVIDDQGVGSVCIIDRAPRSYDPIIAQRLKALAAIVSSRLQDYREIRCLAALKEHSPDAIVTFDGEGVVRGWNPAAEFLFGRCASDIVGQSCAQIIPEEDRAFRLSELQRLARGQSAAFKGRVEKVRGLRADGSVMSLEASYSLNRIGKFLRLSAIMRDCTERDARQAELASALTAAEAGVRAKTAFLANMSHEVRTPLNAIIGLAMAIEQDPGDESARRHAATIQRSGFALKHLLDDVLDASRSAEDPSPKAQDIDLLQLGSSLVDLYGPAAEAKGVKVTFIKQGAFDTRVVGDGVRLRQVLSNLLSNAVKFTERGEISFVISAGDAGDIVFEVRDTGIGFSDDVAVKLFERFYQGDDATTRRFGGAGLGLSICRDLVSIMGGDIFAEAAPGRGAVFTVRLNLPAALPDLNVNHDGCDNDDGIFPRFEGLEILVVDDNAVNRQVLSIMLASLGVDVSCAENGQQALDMAAATGFALIMMDIHMPVMDGLEATRRLHARQRAEGAVLTPIVVVSADDCPESLALSREAGAVAHIGKPVTPAALISAMRASFHANKASTVRV